MLLEARHAINQAADAYRRATDRGHDGAASNLGILLEEQGQLAAAEAAYRKADQRGDAAGAFNLGACMEEQGNLTAAYHAYHRAEQRGNRHIANMARAARTKLRQQQQKTSTHNT